MDFDTQMRNIAETGYSIMPDAISHDLCDEIVAEIARLEREDVAALTPNAFTGFNTVRFFDLLNHGEVWQRVAAHPNLLPVLRGVLGQDMLLSTMGTAVIGPGEPAQPIHRDDSRYDLAMPHRALVCNTMWALTDFTEENGATRVIPGTHTLIADPGRTVEMKSIPAVMPKGSVCFVVGSLYHGGGANRSNARRWALTINYCAGAMRQQENLMLATPREKVATFSTELQALIGYRTTLRGVGHVNAGDPRQLLR